MARQPTSAQTTVIRERICLEQNALDRPEEEVEN
jgi:hypothetical protein